MNALDKILYKELYKKSFYHFVKDFWSAADPAKFVDGAFVQYLCEVWQYICKPWIGYEKPKIVYPTLKEDELLVDITQSDKRNYNITMPPRHSKSMIFNVMGATWLWTFYPIKATSVSHTHALSTEMNSKRKMIINSELYQELFGDTIQLLVDSKTSLKDTRGGELYSINRDAMTGYGSDVIINDDLTNAEAARKNRDEMQNTWSYYQNTMPSRINDTRKFAILNIQQRLAPNDITGHILADPVLSSQYYFLNIPSEFSQTTYFVCPITGKILKWEKGEFLWTERFGNYEGLKAQVGQSVYETQYLQKPIASDRTVIKPDMIREEDGCNVPDIMNADVIYASHDFPVKDKESSDYLGSVLAYKVGQTLYLKDCLEERMAFVKSVNYVRALDESYQGIIQIIEDKANGSPILQQLQDEVAGMQAYQPGTSSKMQRLESASLYLNNVVFVRSKRDLLTQTYSLPESLQKLKERLLGFPFVEHDDIVDAFSMLVLFVFMDRRYMVYGKAFDEGNLISSITDTPKYTNVFFNKEGSLWKVVEIEVQYGYPTKLIVRHEWRFKASVNDALLKLREIAPKQTVFIDCSVDGGLTEVTQNNMSIVRYGVRDFDESVTKLNLALSKKVMLLNKECLQTKSDIESFKFAKTKDETAKYITTKDGFVACLRVALHYYGGIV